MQPRCPCSLDAKPGGGRDVRRFWPILRRSRRVRGPLPAHAAGVNSQRGAHPIVELKPKQTMSDTATSSYRVLARKYRPATFADLIGQDAMVRTISNAFEAGRIPQAWILTGVRGVGKTTTARILARALNYELPDGSVKEPQVRMPLMGIH